jgi:raffinose/stachyose/melibiose transport system substrate-binding protein
MKKNLRMLMLISLSLVVLFVSCSKAAPEKESVKLVFWSQWNEHETQAAVIKEGIELYEEATGNTVEVNWGGRDIWTLVIPALDAEEEVDIFEMASDRLKMYFGTKYLLKLDPYMDKVYPLTNGKPFKDTLLSVVNATATDYWDDGSYYFLPSGGPTVLLFFYNKDIFAEAGVTAPPENWASFLEVCEKVKNAGYYPTTIDDAYMDYLYCNYLEYMKGPDWLREALQDTTGEVWGDPAVAQMAEAFADMYRKGYFHPSSGSNKWPAGQMEIPLGTTAMYICGTWYPNEVAEIAGPDFNWGAFPVPTLPNALFKNDTVQIVSGGYCVNEKTKHPEEAVEFLSYLNSAQIQKRFVEITASPPATVNTEWPDVLKDAEAIFMKATGTMEWPTIIKEEPSVDAVFTDNTARLISGAMTPAQYVADLKAKAHR